MPILELFPKDGPPSQTGPPQTGPKSGPSGGPAGEPAGHGIGDAGAEASAPRHPQKPSGLNAADPKPHRPTRVSSSIKVRTGRFGELEEHEIVHLLDALDDERARAQFRESVYISTIVCLAVAWFLFYGPRVIFHQPYYKDPIAAMKERDREISLSAPAPRLKPPPRPVIDKQTMAQLQKAARAAPPAPQPPAPQEEAHNATPPPPQQQVQQPPLPMAPKAPQSSNIPDAPMPAAPEPRIASNAQSPHDALLNAMRGALRGRSGAEIGAPSRAGPLQAGAEILSDTQGVDFTSYMRKLHDDIQRNWNPLIPEEVEPPLLKKGIVGIRFSILPDGSLGPPMVLETTSGDVALDKAAWWAITSEGQYPPLPKEFHGPKLELRVGFFYNEPIE